jgi:uncharacterized protein
MHLANNINMQNGLVGGVVLAGASSILLYTHAKIAGLSGIVEGLLIFRPHDDKRWCWSFIAGLISSGYALSQVYPQAFAENTTLTASAVIIGGVITGFGTRMGSGCTSGHGICGLPRWSLRSLVAVSSFMFTGAVTAFLTRETALANSLPVPLFTTSHVDRVAGSGDAQAFTALLPTGLAMTATVLTFSYNGWLSALLGRKEEPEEPAPAFSFNEHIGSYACGLLFGAGLGISGMCNPDRVINFLNFSNTTSGWDPSLMAVMGGGVLFNLITFQFLSKHDFKPMLKDVMHSVSSVLKMGKHPANLKIDFPLVAGSMMFGVGWGLAGICPGPGLVSLGALRGNASLFVPSLVGGMVLNQLLTSKNPLNLPPLKSSK